MRLKASQLDQGNTIEWIGLCLIDCYVIAYIAKKKRKCNVTFLLV